MSELADRVRTERQHWAIPGSSHDSLIRALRILLPVAIAVLVVLLAAAPLTMGRDISFVLAKDRVEIARERLRVTEAVYRGADSKGQPFLLRAGSAVQASSRDPVVKLNALSARIMLADGPAVLAALRGRYDMDTQRVMVDGPVVFKAADGYRIMTRDVDIDLDNRHVASGGPVDGQMPLGRFSAGQLVADLNSRTVVLDKGARLHIVQGASR
jgi:lipopolysaccharide export system protein LptC